MNNIVIIVFFILSLGATVLSVYNFYTTNQLKKLRKTILKNEPITNLEEVLNRLHEQHIDLQNQHTHLEQFTQKLSEKVSNTLLKVGMVKFDAFGDQGGKVSFSLALLDSYNSGIVITSVQLRNGSSASYAKIISSGTSDNKLTEEEQKAINSAE